MISISISGASANNQYDEKIDSKSIPPFANYQEDISKLEKLIEKYQKYPKVIVIGNGGSITTFEIYARVLKGNGKKIFILNTNEIDLVNNLKKDYTPLDTVIVAISKSGSTVSIIESLLQFKDYQAIVVTENNDSPIGKIAQYYKWTIVPHPAIGGRFSGFTSSAFVPASLFGLPLETIEKSALQMYELCLPNVRAQDNPAWQVASSLYRLSLVGKDELYIPLYSYYLGTSITFIMQIVHETLGKKGLGWSVISAVAPEAQHHTNQRFIGGKKNMVGIFISIENQRDELTKTEIPSQLKDVVIRDGVLEDMDNVSLSEALKFEYSGTKQHAIENKIPIIDIKLDRLNSQNIAEFIAFWHMTVYYLAILEGVDPFDQPEVERSKEISWQLRKVAHINNLKAISNE
jgi:glucose-6-phosphate isomerase